MKKATGLNGFSLVIWGSFIALSGWLVSTITSDMANGASYRHLILLVCGGAFVGLVLKEWYSAHQKAATYRVFEQTFPELVNSVADLETKAEYCHQLGMVALYRNHLVTNWEFDFVDLTDVVAITYKRTAALKRRTGTVAGDRPILVLSMTDGQQKILSLAPLHPPKDYLPELFKKMSSHNPSMTFGQDRLGVEDYLKTLEEMR